MGSQNPATGRQAWRFCTTRAKSPSSAPQQREILWNPAGGLWPVSPRARRGPAYPHAAGAGSRTDTQRRSSRARSGSPRRRRTRLTCGQNLRHHRRRRPHCRCLDRSFASSPQSSSLDPEGQSCRLRAGRHLQSPLGLPAGRSRIPSSPRARWHWHRIHWTGTLGCNGGSNRGTNCAALGCPARRSPRGRCTRLRQAETSCTCLLPVPFCAAPALLPRKKFRCRPSREAASLPRRCPFRRQLGRAEVAPAR
mmetsp:Transcript_8182/g.25999  ORF Transcript_8182/g.25999 Transcript_8182/m.25999 type:complete len:251 (-) Transcript_8182:297-1049(-)